MYEMRTEDVDKEFSKDKEIFDFSNYSAESKFCDDSNKLVDAKMIYESGGAAIKEFFGLIHSFMENNSEQI